MLSEKEKNGFTLTPSASSPERETGFPLERKNRKESLLRPEREVVSQKRVSAFKIQLPSYGTKEAPLSPNISYKYHVLQELATAVLFHASPF